jgi:anti-anti-sigma factor
MPSSSTSDRRRVTTVAHVPRPFSCEVLPERARVRVVPTGELDLATAPLLERSVCELLEAGFERVVLDLADLDFIDSTGLHLILRLQSSAAAYGCRFSVRPGSSTVQRLFEVTGTLEQVAFEAHARPSRRVWTRR